MADVHLHQAAGNPIAQDASDKANMFLAEFFTCAICHDIMSHPFTIVDCMHKFDRDCLQEFWKGKSICPLCKKPSTKASHDFLLQNALDSALTDTQNTRSQSLDNAPIFPSPLLSLGPNRGFDDIFGDDDDMGDDYDMDEDTEEFTTNLVPGITTQLDRPGGDLIFPCDSCIPGNATGFECEDPIPMPTQQQVDEEIGKYGRPIRVPQPGELRASLTLANTIPGVMAHLQCNSCTIYVPRLFPANIRCTVCTNVYCGQYSGKPNCGGVSLYAKDELTYKNGNVRELAVDSFPTYVKMNRDEVERFETYLTSQNITTQMILQQIVEAKEATYVPNEEAQFTIGSQGVEIGNPWVDAVLCTNCIDMLVRVQGTVWEWWIAERAKGLQDPTITALPDCWYGWECRTQAKASPVPTHASRYNHVCPRKR